MNKAFRSPFKHFGRLPGKIYPFILTPSKTDGRVPSQQGAPPADVYPDITGQFECGHTVENQPFGGY